MAFAAKPEMFNVNLGINPARGADYSAITKVMELFAAFRVHALGNHDDLSVTSVSILSFHYFRAPRITRKLYARLGYF